MRRAVRGTNRSDAAPRERIKSQRRSQSSRPRYLTSASCIAATRAGLTFERISSVSRARRGGTRTTNESHGTMSSNGSTWLLRALRCALHDGRCMQRAGHPVLLRATSHWVLPSLRCGGALLVEEDGDAVVRQRLVQPERPQRVPARGRTPHVMGRVVCATHGARRIATCRCDDRRPARRRTGLTRRGTGRTASSRSRARTGPS